MSMRTRTEALVNAYLNNYQNAQASTVNSGVQATQAARQRGAALLNATDKTLPVLKNQLADVGTAAVAGASNSFKLAQQAAAMANDQLTKKLQDDADLAIQKQHEAWYLAKEAEKAAKAARSSSSSKRGSVTTDSDSYAAMAAAADNLTTQGSTAAKDVQTKPLKGKDTQRSNAERNASARARYDGSEQEKSDIKYRVRQKREQTVQMLKDKQAAANAGANKGKPGGNSYAERQSAAQPAQSVATGRAGNLVGSTTAAAGQGPSIRERRRAKATRNDWASVQNDTATALQRLQNDADYRAELGTPGRKLTQAEINAVNQYGQNAGDLYKQVQNGTLSLDDYNTQAQALSRMNQKASLNGLGQDLQAATAGFMRSFPMQKQTEKAFTDWADKQTGDKYTQAIESGALPAVVPTLDKYTEQDPLAAMGGAMAGKMAQYNAFNQLVDGTGYADAAQKAGGKLYDAAKKIPVLNRIVQPGFGEAAGRVLADTGADFVLDTYPSMMDDMDQFSADRQATARGENVDDLMTIGRMAANAAKNLAGNVAMNALPEIGSAVLNDVKNSFSGAMLDEPLQEAAAVAGKNSSLVTRPDLPRADTPAAVDLEKNADAFLRDANSADAVKNAPDSATSSIATVSQNTAQSLADAADAPGGAVRERGYAASLRTNSDLPDAVKQDFVTAPEVYNQLSNAETKARADAVLANGQGEAVTAYQNMLSQRDPAAVPLGYELAKQYIADGDSDSAVELLRGMSKELTASGQFSQAAAISLMQNDPMTALRYAQRSIDDLNASGAKGLGRQWKDFKLTDAEIKEFENISAGDSEAIAAAMQHVGNRLAKEYPVSFTQKAAEARRLGFLLNPRTQVRNIAANVVQMPVTGLSDKVSAALQSLYAKTGTSPDFVQTKALYVDKASKDIAEQVWNQVKDTINGSSAYEQPISDAVKNAEVFKLGAGQQHNILANVPGMKKGEQALEDISQKFTGENVFDQMSSAKSVLENIRQFTYGLLELGDAPFVKKSFTDSLANIAAANKITSADQITADMIAQATQDAMKATYKDDNAWTQLFSSIHKLGGVGEIVMPFSKTPANMVARSLDYSPVGLAKGLKDFYTKGGNPAEYIDEIAKGLTGSAGMALGAALYKSGVLTGAESDNANKKAFDKQNGFLPFAIHVPDTNIYYRISDFQPSMMSVITGVAFAQAISGDETPEQAAKGAVVAFTNTLADNSNLSNIGDLFGNYDGLGGGLWDAALGLPQSMVPSLSNAIAKSTDTTVRNPYDATDPLQSQKNQIMAKIPGLSKELPAAFDAWGDEKQRDNAAFEQFLDPAAFTNQTVSSRDKEIQRLYEATGDIGVYPPSVKNGTDVDGLKLDNTQTSEYQRTAGQLNRQIVDEVMRTDEYRQADDATRVKMLKSAYEIGREAGKEAANPDYVSENKDYLAYKENGIHDALLTSSVGAVLDKARDEKRETTGNADASLNKVERWNAIPSLDSYDDMVSAYLLNGSDDTAQKLYDKAGAEATAAYLDIYAATTKNGEDDDSAGQLEKLQTALPVLRKYDMTTDQQMDVASMFLQKASPAIRVQEQYGSDMALKYLDAYTKADADGNGKVSDTEFKNALLQSPGLSDDDIGKIYLSSKTTDDSTDEKAQTFSATYGPAGVTDYLYLQYLERAYHTAEANRKIAAGEGGNPDGSFNKSDLVNALNYMDLSREERRAYFSIVAPTWKNPY
uniref:hypothetical protein n=1 Tax=Gemmiger formicilis TaxID=745368 RepID=UPI003FEF02F8